jgi:ribosomal protein S18 acetylase RimI-like enzyme
MTKPLMESVLFRLVGDGMGLFLGQAQKAEIAVHPGCYVALCNEAVADMNGIVAGRGAGEGPHFSQACRACLERGQPFLAMVFPEAGERAKRVAADLGLDHVVDFPIMVREDLPIEPVGNQKVVVRRGSGDDWAEANAAVLASAFGMPRDAVLRALPASLVDSPNVDVFIATIDEATVGAVTMTHHGDTSGVWAMGTDTARQRGGIGRRLLSTAMALCREQHTRRFFLGATPAGYRLYESLGYTTRFSATVWASGETNQA